MEKKKDIIGTLSKGMTVVALGTAIGVGAYCMKEGKPIIDSSKESHTDKMAGKLHDYWVANGSDCRDRDACVKLSGEVYHFVGHNIGRTMVEESTRRHAALLKGAEKEQE